MIFYTMAYRFKMLILYSSIMPVFTLNVSNKEKHTIRNLFGITRNTERNETTIMNYPESETSYQICRQFRICVMKMTIEA